MYPGFYFKGLDKRLTGMLIALLNCRGNNMAKDNTEKSPSISVNLGLPWFTLWIFTMAFAHLTFGQSVLGLLLWPYYLGEALATVLNR